MQVKIYNDFKSDMKQERLILGIKPNIRYIH